MEEKQKQQSANDILNKIISMTLTRHAKLTEEDFLKELKIENPKSEAEEVRNSKFALILAITKEILLANDKLALIDQTYKLVYDLNNKKGE